MKEIKESLDYLNFIINLYLIDINLVKHNLTPSERVTYIENGLGDKIIDRHKKIKITTKQSRSARVKFNLILMSKIDEIIIRNKISEVAYIKHFQELVKLFNHLDNGKLTLITHILEGSLLEILKTALRPLEEESFLDYPIRIKVIELLGLIEKSTKEQENPL